MNDKGNNEVIQHTNLIIETIFSLRGFQDSTLTIANMIQDRHMFRSDTTIANYKAKEQENVNV